ncbi:MAG TPA: hypothetical protein VHV82_14905 [Sporichthyaceae bacterium]|jgi:hypothetical protein|nr:hypothetical protein [Sporichthyaceae bacterium]
MAIVDLGNVQPDVNEPAVAEPAVAEPAARRRSLRPNWSTSAVPWMVAGAAGLAVVVATIVTVSIHATDSTINQDRGNPVQTCLDSGGAAAGCQSVLNGSQTTTGTSPSAAGSALSSISS